MNVNVILQLDSKAPVLARLKPPIVVVKVYTDKYIKLGSKDDNSVLGCQGPLSLCLMDDMLIMCMVTVENDLKHTRRAEF